MNRENNYIVPANVPSFMSLALIAKQQPSAVNALYRLKHEVFKDGALSAKEKALMAVSISCVLKCDTCVEVHAARAKELGATVDELRESILVAMYLTGPSSVVWSPIVDEILGVTSEKETRIRTRASRSS